MEITTLFYEAFGKGLWGVSEERIHLPYGVCTARLPYLATEGVRLVPLRG